MVDELWWDCQLKNEKFLSKLDTEFAAFSPIETREAVIYLLPVSARVKQRFFQIAGRPGADPKTAIVLIDHN
jgi:hypothetical protein